MARRTCAPRRWCGPPLPLEPTVRLDLRHRVPAVLGTAVLLTGATTAAAYALVGHEGLSPTDSGNSQPIDDNHPTASPTPDDRGRVPAPTDDRRPRTVTVPAPVASPDDHGSHHESEPGDDASHRTAPRASDDATHDSGDDDPVATSAPAPSVSPDDHGGSGSDDSSGHGSDGSDDSSGHG